MVRIFYSIIQLISSSITLPCGCFFHSLVYGVVEWWPVVFQNRDFDIGCCGDAEVSAAVVHVCRHFHRASETAHIIVERRFNGVHRTQIVVLLL